MTIIEEIDPAPALSGTTVGVQDGERPAEQANMMFQDEAERLIEGLRPFSLEELGTQSWMHQRENIERLNMQACISANNQAEEFVMSAFVVAEGKISLLVEELITISVWRQKVLEPLLALEISDDSTMTPYLILYHEATICNLLETILYHSEACVEAKDSILDLLDYAYHTTVALMEMDPPLETKGTKSTAKELMAVSPAKALIQQRQKLEWDCAIKMLSIIRYITDYHEELPLSVAKRIMRENDMILALVPLLERRPWTIRKARGVLCKFIDGKWVDTEGAESMKLTKIEGQVWLALYNLLMDMELSKRYNFNSYSKDMVLKLRQHFNEVLIDQLPILSLMQRFLEELSIMTPPDAVTDLVMTQVPEIQARILKTYKGKFADIAKRQYEKVFQKSHDERVEEARRMVKLYGLSDLTA